MYLCLYTVSKPDRQWRSSSFQQSKKVRVSRDLWPWPWPWAHPGCTLTWSPSCESLVAIRPFVCEKKRFAQKFTDRRTNGRRTPRHCFSSFLDWAKNCAKLFFSELCQISPQLRLFGTKMATRINLCDVHSFSTSPNLCQRNTVLNADVPNCYIAL